MLLTDSLTSPTILGKKPKSQLHGRSSRLTFTSKHAELIELYTIRHLFRLKAVQKQEEKLEEFSLTCVRGCEFAQDKISWFCFSMRGRRNSWHDKCSNGVQRGVKFKQTQAFQGCWEHSTVLPPIMRHVFKIRVVIAKFKVTPSSCPPLSPCLIRGSLYHQWGSKVGDLLWINENAPIYKARDTRMPSCLPSVRLHKPASTLNVPKAPHVCVCIHLMSYTWSIH